MTSLSYPWPSFLLRAGRLSGAANAMSFRKGVQSLVTMQDVADRAGVSAKTVSRVFRNEQHVSDAVRQRVSEAMRELNFVPNMLARTFREGKASVLGIAVPSIVDPFFAAIIEAVDSFRQGPRPRDCRDEPRQATRRASNQSSKHSCCDRSAV